MTYAAYNAVTRSMGLRGYTAAELAAAQCTNCTGGSTPPPGSGHCPFQRGTPRELGHPFLQMLAVAHSPDGRVDPLAVQPAAALTAPRAGRGGNR